MGWFLDTLLGYVMTHVVDVEYRRLKNLLGIQPLGRVERMVQALEKVVYFTGHWEVESCSGSDNWT